MLHLELESLKVRQISVMVLFMVSGEHEVLNYDFKSRDIKLGIIQLTFSIPTGILSWILADKSRVVLRVVTKGSDSPVDMVHRVRRGISGAEEAGQGMYQGIGGCRVEVPVWNHIWTPVVQGNGAVGPAGNLVGFC